MPEQTQTAKSLSSMLNDGLTSISALAPSEQDECISALTAHGKALWTGNRSAAAVASLNRAYELLDKGKRLAQANGSIPASNLSNTAVPQSEYPQQPDDTKHAPSANNQSNNNGSDPATQG
jgi:hypothetical protein